jgi:hypothetical protein
MMTWCPGFVHPAHDPRQPQSKSIQFSSSPNTVTEYFFLYAKKTNFNHQKLLTRLPVLLLLSVKYRKQLQPGDTTEHRQLEHEIRNMKTYANSFFGNRTCTIITPHM